MSPQEIHSIRESFSRLEVARVSLCESVHRHIFAVAPTARALFRGDVRQHAVNLMGAISQVIQALDRLETVVPAVQALGRRYADYGVTERHLQRGDTALLRALEDHDEELDPEVKAAWARASALLSGVMLEAAAMPLTA